jgi:hypothetical protein
VNQYSWPEYDNEYHMCENGVSHPIYDRFGNINRTLPLSMYPNANEIHPQIIATRRGFLPDRDKYLAWAMNTSAADWPGPNIPGTGAALNKPASKPKTRGEEKYKYLSLGTKAQGNAPAPYRGDDPSEDTPLYWDGSSPGPLEIADQSPEWEWNQRNESFVNDQNEESPQLSPAVQMAASMLPGSYAQRRNAQNVPSGLFTITQSRDGHVPSPYGDATNSCACMQSVNGCHWDPSRAF